MQIKRGTDYGVRVMCHLAMLPPGRRATLEVLAMSTEVRASFLSKILQRLAAARLVHSSRGVSGGFELARPATSITLLDVIVALEGPLSLNMCLMATDNCHRQPHCPVHQVWAQAQARMAEVIGAATLDTLVAPPPPAPQTWAV